MPTIQQSVLAAFQHHQAGRLGEAERIYRQVLAAEPNNADALHLLGLIGHQLGRHDAAVELIGRAIRVNGRAPSMHLNLGEAQRCLGRLDEAIQCYRRALELNPQFAEAHYDLANVEKQQGRLAEAAASYRRALAIRPDYAEALVNLGIVLHEQKDLPEAVACYRRAIGLRPGAPDAYNNLGAALKDLGELEESFVCLRRALTLKPDYADAHNNLGETHRLAGELDEAIRCYDRALALMPEWPSAHFNRALVWLLQGDFARGWAEYEWRWRTHVSPPRGFPQPLWDGRPLAGRRILLHAEQGLGDTIQFFRYVPLVRAGGGAVIVECQRPVVPLLSQAGGVERLIARGDPLPPFDVHAPLMSLPRLLGPSLDAIPADVPYLHANAALIEKWRDLLLRRAGSASPLAAEPTPEDRLPACENSSRTRQPESLPRTRSLSCVGIAWQGSTLYPADRFRSIPLAQFAPLAAVPGVRLVSLQKGPGTEQIAGVRARFAVMELEGLDETSGPFMDTAAVMASLDLVITSDSAIAHLAGALGVPVWVALPRVPDWRWLLDRPDSPWYPTMRLFRQSRPGAWEEVFARLAAALGERRGR